MDRRKFLFSTGAATAGSLITNPLIHVIDMRNNKLSEDYPNVEIKKIIRKYKEDSIPLASVKGTAYECGIQLGEIWRDIIRTRVVISSKTEKGEPWWAMGNGIIPKLIDKYAPHLREIMKGIQNGAGLKNKPPKIWDWPSGEGNWMFKNECSAFAVKPAATVDGLPLSGQTKDTPEDRVSKYQVLKLEPEGAPSFLTLTYPGELFGHGFATTGVSLFRNALYINSGKEGIPFNVWGLISLCSNINIAIDCALSYGIKTSGNALISDGTGRTVSIECTDKGIGVIEHDETIHVHTNHILAPELKYIEDQKETKLQGSHLRYERLKELLEQELGKISPSRCLQLLGDHKNYPLSICRHDYLNSETTAAVVADPALGRLYVVRGNPCMNWPVTYSF